MRPDLEDEAGGNYRRSVRDRDICLTEIRDLEVRKNRTWAQTRRLEFLKTQKLPEINLQIAGIQMQMPEAEA